MSMPSTERRESAPDKQAGTIDFLYTAVLAIGLTPKVIGLAGMLDEGWVQQNRFPHWGEWEHIAVFVLGLLTLTASWHYYHRPRSRYLHTSEDNEFHGLILFNLQVLMVLLYGCLLLLFRYSRQALLVLTAIFVLYIVWDHVRMFQRIRTSATGQVVRMGTRDTIGRIYSRAGLFAWSSWLERGGYSREMVTIKWTAWIALLCVFSWIVPAWICVGLAIVAVVAYRKNKENEGPFERFVREHR